MIQRTMLHFLEDILKAMNAIDRFVIDMEYEMFAKD